MLLMGAGTVGSHSITPQLRYPTAHLVQGVWLRMELVDSHTVHRRTQAVERHVRTTLAFARKDIVFIYFH